MSFNLVIQLSNKKSYSFKKLTALSSIVFSCIEENHYNLSFQHNEKVIYDFNLKGVISKNLETDNSEKDLRIILIYIIKILMKSIEKNPSSKRVKNALIQILYLAVKKNIKLENGELIIFKADLKAKNSENLASYGLACINFLFYNLNPNYKIASPTKQIMDFLPRKQKNALLNYSMSKSNFDS